MRILSIATIAAGLTVLLAAPAWAAADFRGESASRDARRAADWVVASADNHAMPFVIVDKLQAKVFVFDVQGRLKGASPALLGLAHGDSSAPGIGQRKLAAIRPDERTTPAGRFVASLGNDLGEKDILWVDYENAISMHRVITGNRHDQRLRRLASSTIADNRITYGCINVPVKFYETYVRPSFTGTSGVVYILPDVKPMRDVFPGAFAN
jgi:hypothetical protein